MISVVDTGFDGLKIIETNHFQDERGLFHKYFSKNEFAHLGLDIEFEESYYSINKKGVIRGMHFQIPPAAHTKLVYVTYGKIIDVCLDIRKNSVTYGKYFSIELSGNIGRCIYIPKGFAHGFVSLKDRTCVHYMQTSCYSKEYDCGIRYDSFGYDWNVQNPVLSYRDEQHPKFMNFTTPF
ncbi:MAG: dTDP-4-dehydrorhamnose 3,5-epimerase [Treponema sp.]|nr:dTDP-4-dehydrorhamnose 3,5-epimerase [Treponema sp.]